MPDSLLESSTKILYSIDSLSGDVKLYWSKYLSFSFPSFTQAQKRQKEILLAAKPLITKEAVASEFNSLNDEEKIWVLASLKLLTNYSAKTEDWISNREIILLMDQLNSADRSEGVNEKYAEISKVFHDFENRKIFFIDGSISLFSLDYLLRWLALLLCNSFEVKLENFILLNFLVVSPIILAIAFWRSRADRIYNQKLVSKIGFAKLFRVKYSYTGLQYSITAFYLITGLLTAFLLVDNFGPGIGMLLSLTLYYLFLFNLLPIGRLTEYDLLQQIHSKENQSSLDADSNDEAIVSIETQLNSSTGRLEAYVLESALFGALAFSGFLQIIATDLISFPDLEKFASNSFHVSRSLLNANWTEFNKYALLLDTKVSLFCLVSIETLICSALFLAVIASRLRFSDVADRVRTSLNLAKAYNEKEEQILLSESSEKNLSRLQSINDKIYQYLEESRLHLSGVTPIVSYMVYFRNAGLFTFLAVLVTSSLFVSSFMGWSFVAMGLITVIYFNMKSIRSSFSSFGFRFQILFAKYSKVLLAITVVPGLLSFFLSTVLHWPHLDFLISLSYLLSGIYVYVWFVLMPHPDERFGDIENLHDEAWRSSGWRLIKNVYGMFILISFIGFGFKVSFLTGANEMLLIGFSGLSIGSYFVGFYLTRPRWLGFLIAVLFGTACMGTLFKILHFAGANEMNIVASVLTPLFIVLYFLKRKSFHFILFRIAMVFFALVFLFSALLPRPPWRWIQIAYAHRTLSTAKIFDYSDRIQQQFESSARIDTAMLARSIKACDEYLAEYGDRYGKTEIHRQAHRVYFEIAFDNIPENQPQAKGDSASLAIGLKAANEILKITAVFHEEYLEEGGIQLKAAALIGLGRKEEAKSFLKDVIAKSKDDDIVRDARNKLQAVEKLK